MERANVRLASRRGGGRRPHPRHCLAFCRRCTMMRSNRPLATATARKSHAAHTPCKHQDWRLHGTRETCDLWRRGWMLL
eukprot:2301124-Lingulodinium_polyedra.AAC.1